MILKLHVSNGYANMVFHISRISSACRVIMYVEDQQTGMSISNWRTGLTLLRI